MKPRKSCVSPRPGPPRGTLLKQCSSRRTTLACAGLSAKRWSAKVTACSRRRTVFGAARNAAAHIGPIHLLLTDLVMPGLSGREAAARVLSARPEIRVLYMSGYTDDTVLRRGILERGSAYLQKPFSPEVLLRKIRLVLDSPA